MNKRELGGFDEMTDVAINSDSDNKKESSSIKDILGTRKAKSQTHIFKGFYIENEIADLIDEVSANRPRGTKSELVNGVLKKFLQEEGLL